MKPLTRRTVAASLLSLVVVVACSCGGSDPEQSEGGAAPTLRVGQLRSNLEPLLQAAGQLDELPYKIEWSSFDIGPDAIAAEGSGAVDISYMADTPPIFAQAAHVGVKIVGLTRAPGGARNVAIVVRTDSGIGSATDLAGKKVAVIPGTITQYLLLRALDTAGLALSDVTQVNLQGPDAIDALRQGDVDGVVLVDPLLATGLATGDARVLLDGSGLLSGSNALVATQRALDDPARAQAIGDLLTRVKAAFAWARANPSQWASTYASVNHLSDEAALQAVQRSSMISVPINQTAIAGQQNQADAFTSIGLLKEQLDVSEEFDDRYNSMLFGERQAG